MAIYNIKVDTEAKTISFTKDGVDLECERGGISVCNDRNDKDEFVGCAYISYDSSLTDGVWSSKMITVCNEETEESEVEEFSPASGGTEGTAVA